MESWPQRREDAEGDWARRFVGEKMPAMFLILNFLARCRLVTSSATRAATVYCHLIVTVRSAVRVQYSMWLG